MRLWVAGIGLAGVLWGAFSSFHADRPATIVLTGDFMGSMEPCGCTSPTTGGILRQAALIRQMRQGAEVTVLANGAMTAGSQKQDGLKTETLADFYRSVDVAAINLSAQDAKLGPGGLLSLQNVSSDKVVSGSIQPNGEINLQPLVRKGPFVIAGASTHTDALARSLHAYPVETATVVRDLLSDAKEDSLTPVLLLDGNLDEARALARSYPALKLIAYRSENDPPAQPIRVGQTVLFTSGEKGKFLTTLNFDGGEFVGYQSIRLGPEVKDDAETARIYKKYLDAVDRAGFLDHLPRRPSDPFSGSDACAKCHRAAYETWRKSKHGGALASLEKVEHSRDPDCVYCHVVGLQAIGGFQSRAKTPKLANVGCESCHGPGEAHVLKPRTVRLPKVGFKMCSSCHTPDQSPNFKSLTFWKKIAHR